MFKNSVGNSISLKLLKYISKQYLYIEKYFTIVYAGSYVNIHFKKCFKIIKIYFKNSILGRITEIETSQDTAILDNSKFFWYLSNIYRENILKFKNFSNASKLAAFVDSIHNGIDEEPLKTVSFIVAIAVIANSFLSITLKKDITLWAYVLRGLILFASLSVYFSDIDWLAIKQNSIFIKFVAKR